MEFWIGYFWEEPRLRFRDDCYRMSNDSTFRADEKEVEDYVWLPPLGVYGVQNVKKRSSLR